MADLVAHANSAFVDDDYVLAADLYSKAIKSDPENPALYTSRAQAQILGEDYIAAVESCNQAIKLDASNSKAQYRRGVACWHLEELETALEAFQAAQHLGPPSSQISTWISKCQAKLAEEAGGQNDASAPTGQPSDAAAAHAQPSLSSGVSPTAAETADVPAEGSHPVAEPPKPSKYRHQWLQTRNVVEVSIFAKAVTEERLSVDIAEDKLHVVIRDAEGEQEYEMAVDLFSGVDCAASKWQIFGTKVEIVLAKKDKSVSWPTLEASESRPAANWSLPEPPRSSYPTSSKSTRDWNKIEADIKKEEDKEDLDGDAGVQKLFKTIYGGADEDTRRAMNKSYQESNGTALSTNWKDIKAKSEWAPPDNADVKKW